MIDFKNFDETTLNSLVYQYLDSKYTMRKSFLGFTYLIDVIVGRLKGRYNNKISATYKIVGRKYNVKEESVERNLRHLIRVSTDKEFTTKEFIESIIIDIKFNGLCNYTSNEETVVSN